MERGGWAKHALRGCTEFSWQGMVLSLRMMLRAVPTSSPRDLSLSLSLSLSLWPPSLGWASRDRSHRLLKEVHKNLEMVNVHLKRANFAGIAAAVQLMRFVGALQFSVAPSIINAHSLASPPPFKSNNAPQIFLRQK